MRNLVCLILLKVSSRVTECYIVFSIVSHHRQRTITPWKPRDNTQLEEIHDMTKKNEIFKTMISIIQPSKLFLFSVFPLRVNFTLDTIFSVQNSLFSQFESPLLCRKSHNIKRKLNFRLNKLTQTLCSPSPSIVIAIIGYNLKNLFWSHLLQVLTRLNSEKKKFVLLNFLSLEYYSQKKTERYKFLKSSAAISYVTVRFEFASRCWQTVRSNRQNETEPRN